MKLSAILVSVNLVAATVPLAAQASEEAVSDKADWIKRNLATLSSSPVQQSSAASRKISLSDPGVSARKKPKLRPFVPYRPLPSQRDILLAQQARMDESLSTPRLAAQHAELGESIQPLSGQVSAYAMQIAPASGGDSRRISRARIPAQAAPRSVPGHVPTLPGQVAAVAPKASPIPFIPEPPPAPVFASAPSSAAHSTFNAMQPEKLVKQAGALLVQAPVLTPDERALVEELVELNKPGRSLDFIDIQNGQKVMVPDAGTVFETPAQASVPSRPDIGPPPFPLNLLPQDALQSFVGRRNRSKTSAPPAYFGSWHQPTARNLPQAGFHSHIASRKVLASHFSHHAPAIHSAKAKTVARRKGRTQSAGSATISQSNVAMYPPYESQSRVSMF